MTRNTPKHGRIIMICSFALSFMVLSAWPSEPRAAEISENIAIQAVAGEIPSLDPPNMFVNEDTSIGHHVYETLTRWDAEKGLVPVLATSWESNEDGTRWTFKLREGVKFHDGTPFTATDVKASFDRTIELGFVGYDFVGVESIEVVDDFTVRFVASAPRNLPLIVSAQYGMLVYKAEAVTQPPEWWAQGNDAGTGPYTVASYESGTRAILDYYPEYWGGWEEGQFTKIVYLIVEDPTVRDQMIRSGEVDVTSELPFDSIASLEATSGMTVYPYLPLAQLLLALDLSNPPLDNVEVRRALAMSFPYDDVHQGVYLGHGRVSMGSGPTALWDPPADFPRYELDIDRAKALLEKAGFGDGFELDLALQGGNKENTEAIRLWQAQLSKLNIKLNIRELAGGAFWDYAFNPDNEEFDVFVVAASGDVPSPYAWLIIFTPHGWFPAIGYENPEFYELVFDAWALEATDAQAANDVWVKAQRILHEDAASIFAMDAPQVFAYGDDITGFSVKPPYSSIVFWYEMKRRQ